MPEISRFFGIVIAMYYRDHAPPHFHARFSEHRALIEIETMAILRGHLPARALGLVVEWGVKHRSKLLDDWGRAARNAPLIPIPPLE